MQSFCLFGKLLFDTALFGKLLFGTALFLDKQKSITSIIWHRTVSTKHLYTNINYFLAFT